MYKIKEGLCDDSYKELEVGLILLKIDYIRVRNII